MKIIGNAEINLKKVAKCYICGALIEYEDKELYREIKHDNTSNMNMDIWSRYLYCPVCKQKLIVDEAKLGNF